jgi:hypothetical protein
MDDCDLVKGYPFDQKGSRPSDSNLALGIQSSRFKSDASISDRVAGITYRFTGYPI